MSAPRRPGDDRRAGRRAGSRAPSRDRRDASPREAKPAGSKPRDDEAAKDGKPARGTAKAGKPRTARSEAWAATKAPREGERERPARPPRGPGRPSADRKPRGRHTDRDDQPATGQNAAPWENDAARPAGVGAKRTAVRRPDMRRTERPAAPAPRPPRREAEDGGRPKTPAKASGRRPGTRPGEPRDADRGEALFTRPPRRGAAPRVSATGGAPRSSERRPVARPASPRPHRADAAPVDRKRPDRARPTPRATAPAVPASPPVEPSASSRKAPQRIAKLLARAGVASRREIERMIAEGRIALNGVTLDKPATVLPSLHGVTVDGQPVDAPEPTRLFLFHKPTGFLTTEHDPAGRPTIYDRLPEGLPRVMPVGRLDMNTEGLLLLTTDGEFKRKLELPSSGIPRVYRARAYGEVTQEQLEALSEGITIEGIRYGSIDANMERRTGRNVWIEMKITEGKNREVRRVLEYLGLQVSRLIRVAYGEFVLADLPAGEVVEVRQHDLVEFRKTLR